tara:strand:+ start:467 stop:1954 length:1488 start_codon:yes stop_codon:yes gene_type:complete
METSNHSITIVFPNQLFKDSPILNKDVKKIFLIEEHLFFKHYKFHKQKIAYHRSSMRKYYDYLKTKDFNVEYIHSFDKSSDIRTFLDNLDNQITNINIYDPVDDWLLKRINNHKKNININISSNPLFINTNQDLSTFFRNDKKNYSHAVFYKQQRKSLNILMDSDDNPVGGKYSFDSDNRKKYPNDEKPPHINFPKNDSYWSEAIEYTNKYLSDNYGDLSTTQYYPNDFTGAEQWLDNFLVQRFEKFGDYEDAIESNQVFLNHSVLTPMLNSGLITPRSIIDKTLEFSNENDIPINSLEGFIRQIIGWREFIRGMYIAKGSFSRTENFWSFKRKIPSSFYTGDTGIDPVDDSIKKTIKYGYSHHIERLMVLGNFMLLCEFDPDEVYKWFMELFIDAYDWVMVPNVYGMSQFSDGGTFATKPYISSSNYIKKMSNYKNGEWTDVWDGLYWNFINNQSDFFSSNPRLSMMCHLFNRMKPETKEKHIQNAKNFLSKLD